MIINIYYYNTLCYNSTRGDKMKLVRFSIDLLKREKKSSILYVVSLLLSTAAIHVLICIYQNPNYFTTDYNYNKGLLSTNYGVMVLAVCIIILLAVYAHNYFLTEKYKFMGIMRLGGSNFKEVLTYILTQTFMLVIIALPIGLVLGTLIYLYINHLFVVKAGFSGGGALSIESFLYSLVILFILIFYLAIITVGFVHRHEITELLGYKKSMDRNQDSQKMLNFSTPGIFYLFLIIGGLFIIIRAIGSGSNVAIVVGIISLAAFMDGFVSKWLSPFIEKLRRGVFITNQRMVATLGFVNVSLRRVIVLVQLLGGSLLATSSYLARYIDSISDFIYFYLLFLIFVVLTSLALLYQILMETASRKESLKQLYIIGYTKKDIQSIVRNEIVILMTIIFIIGYIYTFFAYINYVKNGIFELALAIQLSGIYTVSLFIIGIVSYQMYKKIVMKEIR